MLTAVRMSSRLTASSGKRSIQGPAPASVEPPAPAPLSAAPPSSAVVGRVAPDYPRWFRPLATLAEGKPRAALLAVLGALAAAWGTGFGMAWLMNTMELYPEVMAYGRYGVLSERTCPSDGLLVERYADGAPASTWWSYNAWAAGSAMEAIAERILRRKGELEIE